MLRSFVPESIWWLGRCIAIGARTCSCEYADPFNLFSNAAEDLQFLSTCRVPGSRFRSRPVPVRHAQVCILNK